MTAVLARSRSASGGGVRRFLAWSLVVYGICRILDVLVMVWIAGHQDPAGVPGGTAGSTVGYWDMTHMWDGGWYQKIVDHGYPRQVPRDSAGLPQQSELAFYPLYPMIVRGLMALTGGSFAVVGSLLSLVLGAAATVLMALLLRRKLGARVALAAVIVVNSSPPAATFQMTYTESLAMLLLAGVLLALDDERWALAGLLGVLIGFTRPIGIPLAVVVAVLVLRRVRERSRRPISRREYVELGIGLVGCGLAGVLWSLTTWALTGTRDAYSSTMTAWRNHHPLTPFSGAVDVLARYMAVPWAVLLVILAFILVAALVLGPWNQRLGLMLRCWCVAYALYLFATLEPWSSTLRYLLELFPLAAVLIGAGWHRRSRLMGPLTVLLVLVNVLGTVWWAWTFLRFVPPYGNPL